MPETAQEAVFGQGRHHTGQRGEAALQVEDAFGAVWVVPMVQRQIDQSEGKLSQHEAAGAVVAGGAELVVQVVRQRLAGLHVAAHAEQRFAVVAPVFHELAGQLHGIPIHVVDTRRHAVVHGRQHVVQAVSELVKQGAQLGERHERGLVAHGWGLVADEVGHRQADGLTGRRQQAAAAHEFVHPGAAALFRRSAVRIEVKGGDCLVLLVVDTEKPHVVVPHRNAVRRLDTHAEQTPGEGEQAVQNTRQGEVRPQGFLAEVVLLFALALGPERQVPVAQIRCLGGSGCRGALALVLQILLTGGQGGLPQLFQKALDSCHVGRHLACQAEFRIAFVAQQDGHFLSQLQNSADQRGVVQVAVAGAADRGTIKLLPVVAPPAVRHEGHEGWVIQGNAPRPVFRAGVRASRLAGGLGGDVQQAGRQALHVLRVLQGQSEGLGGIQHVVAEAGADLGQFLLDSVEALSFLALQPDAGKFGVAQQHLDDTLLGGVANLPGGAVS